MPAKRARTTDAPEGDIFSSGFIKAVILERERVASFKKYPFSIPAVQKMETLEFHPKVTFLVGENGVGKSTLIEAIAVAAGFNAEGGSKNFNFATRKTHSKLSEALTIKRGIYREEDGFFLRAESLYNVASNIEDLDKDDPGLFNSYGGKSLHEQSHGEAFLALATHRFRGKGFYILDEPESALSPSRQLALLQIIHQHVQQKRSQFLIATHSPILMAYPDATIYHLSEKGINPIPYEETEHFQITRDFLTNRKTFLHHLLNAV
ncbi:MAG TPA: AAA family ATPase [Chthonomonadaceae bacterium]|nr:AAA family ATPase [Chthonomonadaceae bacterium]